MKSRFTSLFAAAAVVAAGAAHAATVSYDFETDQSGSFVAVEEGGPDSLVEYQYDYSTYVTGSSIAYTIPQAPNSASGTTGLRVSVNDSLAAVNIITLYPDVSSLPGIADGDWSIQFDLFMAHNGDAGGGSGSTEFAGVGAQSASGNNGLFDAQPDGFNFLNTGDGGAGQDYRYYEGATTARDDAKANFWGANELNNVDAGPSAFFPNDGVSPNDQPPAGAVAVGVPGKQWITVRLTTADAGATRTLEYKKPQDASFTVVGTVTGGLGSALAPLFGYGDIFSSVALPGADNFGLFDNVIINDSPTTNVNDWTLY